jgi:hypothetical protein
MQKIQPQPDSFPVLAGFSSDFLTENTMWESAGKSIKKSLRNYQNQIFETVNVD